MQMINCSYFLRLLIEFAFATLGRVTSAARSCNSWWQLCDLLPNGAAYSIWQWLGIFLVVEGVREDCFAAQGRPLASLPLLKPAWRAWNVGPCPGPSSGSSPGLGFGFRTTIAVSDYVTSALFFGCVFISLNNAMEERLEAAYQHQTTRGSCSEPRRSLQLARKIIYSQPLCAANLCHFLVEQLQIAI